MFKVHLENLLEYPKQNYSLSFLFYCQSQVFLKLQVVAAPVRLMGQVGQLDQDQIRWETDSLQNNSQRPLDLDRWYRFLTPPTKTHLPHTNLPCLSQVYAL